MVKGFEYRIDQGDKHLFITNKFGNEINFRYGDFQGTPAGCEDMHDGNGVSITEEQFIQLVDRLNMESEKIRKRLGKKTPKATLDFGESSPKKGKK